MSGRAFKAQREDSIKRTVYVSDIDHNVRYNLQISLCFLTFVGLKFMGFSFFLKITEEQLAALFSGYGQV